MRKRGRGERGGGGNEEARERGERRGVEVRKLERGKRGGGWK